MTLGYVYMSQASVEHYFVKRPVAEDAQCRHMEQEDNIGRDEEPPFYFMQPREGHGLMFTSRSHGNNTESDESHASRSSSTSMELPYGASRLNVSQRKNNKSRIT